MSLKINIEDSPSCNTYGDLKEATTSESEGVAQNVIVDQLYDMLACKICYDPFTECGSHTPMVMKCGHSVCLQCVGMIYKKRSAIICPFCNSSVRAQPKTLPKNFDIISMLPHYPKLPPNHKPYNVEVEKMKMQYTSEKAFVAQLTINSEQAGQLVKQAEQQLAKLRSHADIAKKQLQQAEEARKATEDSLRLFIDLRPEDPLMVALAEQLPKPPSKTPNSILESIRQAKAKNRSQLGGSGSSSSSSSSSGSSGQGDFLNEILQGGVRLQRSRSVAPPAPPGGPPPPPPRPFAAATAASAISSVPQHDNSFARSIAAAAARMHELNNPPAQNEDASPSPRQLMLSLIRGSGN